MTAIKSITVKGFRSIRAVERLELRPINVLIGANGSGKSNFLSVFDMLHSMRMGRFQRYVAQAGGANEILHFGAKTTDDLSVEVEFGDGSTRYEALIFPTPTDSLRMSDTVHYWNDAEQRQERIIRIGGRTTEESEHTGQVRVADVIVALERGFEAGDANHYSIGNPDSASRAAPVSDVQNHIETWRVYHFLDTGRTSPIKRNSNLHDNRYLRPDGANLAAFLYLLREKYAPSYREIRNTVRMVAPFFDDFFLEPLALNPDMIRLAWRHKRSDAYFDASSLSDGTLRFMALATLMLQPKELRPSVILIDEPEIGLHPYAIWLFASLVDESSLSSQIILSTQSPALLDYFEPEDVIVTDLHKGQSKFRRLDSDSLSAWLEDYTMGELWNMNKIGGRPAIG